MRDGDETPQISTKYADSAVIVSRSPVSLAKMMTAAVEVCRAYRLTVAEKEDRDDGHASTTSRTRGPRDSGITRKRTVHPRDLHKYVMRLL